METEAVHRNWVPKRFIYVPGVLSLAFFGLSFMSPLFLIGATVSLLPASYFGYAYYQCSPRGGNLQDRIRDLLFDYLVWDGCGELLDVGCGNGALAVAAARRYPRSRVTGIDTWGGSRGWSKESCERNAEVSGVCEQTSFQRASAACLPFEDESFDVVVSNFVFHEVIDTRDVMDVVREALRVVKTGGLFAFQDLFLLKKVYSETRDLVATIKDWGVQDAEFVRTNDQKFIRGAMRLPFLVGRTGIIYGRK